MHVWSANYTGSALPHKRLHRLLKRTLGVVTHLTALRCWGRWEGRTEGSGPSRGADPGSPGGCACVGSLRYFSLLLWRVKISQVNMLFRDQSYPIRPLKISFEAFLIVLLCLRFYLTSDVGRGTWEAGTRFLVPHTAACAGSVGPVGPRARRAGKAPCVTMWGAVPGSPAVPAAWLPRTDHAVPELQHTL